jgi:hypothetical protein
LVASETARTAKPAGTARTRPATVRVKRITVAGVINPALDQNATSISTVSAATAVSAPPAVAPIASHQSKLAIVTVAPLTALGAVASITAVASATATTAMDMKLHRAVYNVNFKVNRAAISARASVRASHAVAAISTAVSVLRTVVINPVAVRSLCLWGLRRGYSFRGLRWHIPKIAAVDFNVCNAH